MIGKPSPAPCLRADDTVACHGLSLSWTRADELLSSLTPTFEGVGIGFVVAMKSGPVILNVLEIGGPYAGMMSFPSGKI